MLRKKTGNRRVYLTIYTSVIALILILFLLIQPFDYNLTIRRSISPSENIPQEIRVPLFHAHADFKVFLDGEEFSFNKTQFDVANKYIHLHLRNPDGDKVIHIEGMENVTLKIFFDSLNIKFNASCFITESESYCNTFEKKIRIFVNGGENLQFDFYEPRNIDRILITYGDETDEEIMKQMDSVTDYACIYSNRCPERIPELPVPETELIF